MTCPRCQSHDVVKSHRKFVERMLLPVVKAEVFRCRDCRKRFWDGVQWAPIILCGLTMAFGAIIGLAMIAAHETQAQPKAPPAPLHRPRR